MAITGSSHSSSNSDQPLRLASGPSIPAFEGDVELADAYAALANGSWQPAAALLESRSECTRTLNALTCSKIELATIAAWVEAAPTARTTTILGAAQLRNAWKIRGAGPATSVPFDAAMDFIAHIKQAEETLFEAADLDPTSAEPWANLITTAVALSLDHQEIERRFKQAHERTPFHTTAVRRMGQARSWRWGGNDELALSFARWVGANAPAGHPALCTVLDCHVEIGTRDATTIGDVFSYLATDRARHDIEDAFARLVEGLPAVAPTDAVRALNRFVFWVPPTGERTAELNLAGFKALANRPTNHPWSHFSDGHPAVMFRRQQHERRRHSEAMTSIFDAALTKIEHQTPLLKAS